MYTRVKGLWLSRFSGVAITIALTACSMQPQSSEQLTNLLDQTQDARIKGKIDTAIPLTKEACTLALAETPENETGCGLRKRAYQEAIDLAKDCSSLGRLTPASELLSVAIKLEGTCGISGTGTDSASYKLTNLKKTETQELDAFNNVKTELISGQSTAEVQERIKNVYRAADNWRFAKAEKLALQLLEERKSRVEYTSDTVYRRVLAALEYVYKKELKYKESAELYQKDSAIQKSKFTEEDLKRADPSAFYAARFYADDLTHLARSLAYLGRYEEAHQLVNEAAALFQRLSSIKDPREIIEAKAEILEAQGRWQEAIKYRSTIVDSVRHKVNRKGKRLDMEFVENCRKLAIDYTKNSQFDEAFKTSSEVADLAQQHLDFNWAPTLIMEAAIAAQRAKNKSSAQHYLNLAKASVTSKRQPEAIGYYHIMLGGFARESGKLEEAVSNYRKAISMLEKLKLGDQHDQASALLADTLQQMKRTKEALQVLDQVIKNHPTDTRANELEHLNLMISAADYCDKADQSANALKRIDDAISYMETLSDLPVNAPELYLKAARIAGKSQVYVNKAKEAQKRINATPEAMAHLDKQIEQSLAAPHK